MRRLAHAAAIFILAAAYCDAADVRDVIPWLIQNDRELPAIPLPEVIQSSTGCRVIPVGKQDASWLATLSEVLDRVVHKLNAPEHPIHNAGRINEASRYIEDALREELNRVPGWKCTVPTTANGKEQRSGYPDLRLELADHSVVYLDPKLYAKGSRESSLRTFYYEPRMLTGKIHDDARHLLVGIPHDNKTPVRFVGWDLVDASRIKVRLKAEFQASNRDIYTGDSILESRSASDRKDN